MKITYIIAELMIEYSVNMSKQNDIVIEKPEKKKQINRYRNKEKTVKNSWFNNRVKNKYI